MVNHSVHNYHQVKPLPMADHCLFIHENFSFYVINSSTKNIIVIVACCFKESVICNNLFYEFLELCVGNRVILLLHIIDIIKSVNRGVFKN